MPQGRASPPQPPGSRPRPADARLHDLRRLNATEMVRVGVDIKTAQHRLGRSDPRLTLYAEATTEADVEAAGRLGARLLQERPEMAGDGREAV